MAGASIRPASSMDSCTVFADMCVALPLSVNDAGGREWTRMRAFACRCVVGRQVATGQGVDLLRWITSTHVMPRKETDSNLDDVRPQVLSRGCRVSRDEVMLLA